MFGAFPFGHGYFGQGPHASGAVERFGISFTLELTRSHAVVLHVTRYLNIVVTTTRYLNT